MLKTIVAATLAVSSLFATAMPSYADSVTVQFGEPGHNNHPFYRHDRDRYDRYRHRVQYHRCWTESYQVRISHGREVTKYRKVCR